MGAEKGDRDADRGTEMSTRDEVSLSSQERQLLAHLEARARSDDPALAARLRGRTSQALLARWRERQLPHLPNWAGPVLVLVGLVITVVALTTVVWFSILGLAMCVAGGCAVGVVVRERIQAKR